MRRLAAIMMGPVVLAACLAEAPGPRRARAQAEARQHPGRIGVAPDAMPSASPTGAASTVSDGVSGPSTVVLVVLDTVRADRTSLCGHDRPTTPTLQWLAARPDAVSTCHAITPGTWTIPTHASLFTGLAPPDHGLLRKGQRLEVPQPTLAEVWRGRGYRTVLLSANPVLKEATGLQRGFDRVELAERLVGPFRGVSIHDRLRRVVAEAGEAPLLLVVNLFDAHDPYPAIPAGHPFLPAQGPVHFPTRRPAADHPFWHVLRGTLTGPDRDAWLTRVGDGYDHGVSVADASLGVLWDALAASGRTGDLRMVVTSDHGEHLGEHGLLRHDGPPWQTVVQVPWVWVESGRGDPASLPTPLSVRTTWEVLVHGRMPEDDGPVASMSIRYGERNPALPFETAVALWPSADRKWMWRESVGAEVYDLEADPGERSPRRPGARVREGLERAAAVVTAAREAAMSTEADPALSQMLEELGYVTGVP